MSEVALVATEGEPGCDFPQASLGDRLVAERAERLRVQCAVIHQNELHAATLNVQNEQLGDRLPNTAREKLAAYCRRDPRKRNLMMSNALIY
jgi:hypothetical protein